MKNNNKREQEEESWWEKTGECYQIVSESSKD